MHESDALTAPAGRAKRPALDDEPEKWRGNGSWHGQPRVVCHASRYRRRNLLSAHRLCGRSRHGNARHRRPRSFFSEEKTDTDCKVAWMKDGVPAFEITNTCKQGRYVIKKWILTDPRAPRLVSKNSVRSHRGIGRPTITCMCLLAPHLGDRGDGNNGRVGDFKGIPMLMAEREGFGLGAGLLGALAAPFGRLRRRLRRLARSACPQAYDLGIRTCRKTATSP